MNMCRNFAIVRLLFTRKKETVLRRTGLEGGLEVLSVITEVFPGNGLHVSFVELFAVQQWEKS